MTEKSLHKAVCDYIRLQYPGVLFNSDLSGATRLTMGQAVAMKSLRSNRGWPDIFIAEPGKRFKYHGLFIELKKEGEKLFKKNNEPITEHIAEQIIMIGLLRERGFKAEFAIGFDQAKTIIDQYMKL